MFGGISGEGVRRSPQGALDAVAAAVAAVAEQASPGARLFRG